MVRGKRLLYWVTPGHTAMECEFCKQRVSSLTSDLLELNFFRVFLLYVNLSHFILTFFSNPNSGKPLFSCLLKYLGLITHQILIFKWYTLLGASALAPWNQPFPFGTFQLCRGSDTTRFAVLSASPRGLICSILSLSLFSFSFLETLVKLSGWK